MTFDKWLITENKQLGAIRRHCLYTSDGLVLLSKLFGDNDVVSLIRDAESDLVAAFSGDSTPDEHHQRKILLAFTAERIARRIFLSGRKYSREYHTAVNFPAGFLHGRSDCWEKAPNDPEGEPETEWLSRDKDELTMEHVQAIENWAISNALAFLMLPVDENWVLKFTALLNVGTSWDRFDSRIIAYLLLDLGGAYEKGNDKKKALSTNIQSLTYNSTCFERYSEILDMYGNPSNKSSGWDRMMRFLEKLNVYANQWESYLDEVVSALFLGRTRSRQIALAAEVGAAELSGWSCIKSMYETAIKFADEKNDMECQFLLRYSYATTLSFVVANDEGSQTAISMLEESLKHASQLEKNDAETGNLLDAKYYINHAVGELARLYHNRLLLSRGRGGGTAEGTAEDERIRSEFETLLRKRNAGEDKITLSCYLARRDKANGTTKEEQKKALEKAVKTASDMLSDDTSSSDQLACEMLFQVAVTMGDEDITTVLWKLLYVFKRIQSDGSDNKGPADDEETNYFCDGCGKRLLVDEEVYACGDCAGEAFFHKDCYERVTEGSLQRLCGKHHDFVYISLSSEKASRINSLLDEVGSGKSGAKSNAGLLLLKEMGEFDAMVKERYLSDKDKPR
ncbi:hypothetical protein B0J18DRAFT_469293 [Chaetomium sp. MPI-SDFR-AT-0129]|nr:hypothetical protein B0J18DRAFT_469293 [Chaetomium sp. MPI-SDFR-AT-0129]